MVSLAIAALQLLHLRLQSGFNCCFLIQEYLGQIEKVGLSYISPVQKILADNGVNLSGRVLLLAVASFFIFILFFGKHVKRILD